MSDPSDALSDYDREKQEPALPEPATEKQRLRISVPRLRTTLTMGEGAKDGQLYMEDPTSVLHFPGFGVTTEGDLHMETRGPRESSRVKLQTNGEVSVHSVDDTLNLGAKRGVICGTDENNTMWGAGGTYILGGAFGPLGMLASSVAEGGLQDPLRGHHPKTPAWVDAIENVKTAVKLLFLTNGLYSSKRLKAAEKLKKDQKLEDVAIDKAKKPSQWHANVSAALDAVDALYGAKKAYDDAAKRSDDDKSGAEKLLDEVMTGVGAVLAGTTIIGQGGVSIASPNTVSVTGLAGVGIAGRLSVALQTDHIATIESARAISLLAGENMEAFAAKNMTLAASKVTHVGSNDRLTLTAQNVALMKSKRDASVYGERSVNVVTKGEGRFVSGNSVFSAKEIADFDGEKGAYFRSASGIVAIVSHEKDVSVGGATAANLHSGDALVRAEPGKLTLTVDGDAADMKAEVSDYYEPMLEDVLKKWSAAREENDHDEMNKLHEDLKKLMKARKGEMDTIDGKVEGHSANLDNGIEITSSKISLKVGGDEVKIKSGKVEVFKTLEIKG